MDDEPDDEFEPDDAEWEQLQPIAANQPWNAVRLPDINQPIADVAEFIKWVQAEPQANAN
jgi:hypothetical protein